MLSYLFLKNCHVSEKDSLLFDSAMLLMKQSSSGLNIHFNYIGKPNHMFAWFVIDFLLMLLLFDTFVDHRSLMAPVPYAYGHKDLTDQEQGMLKHNQKILINFCFIHHPAIIQKYFMIARTGNIGQGCVNLDSLCATSTKLLRQSKTGSVSLFESYKATYTNIKKEQPLWIHHFAILQLFHPYFRMYLNDSLDVNFLNDNYHLFLRKLSPEDLKSYIIIYGDSPNYSFLWVGEGGHLR
jgi:hypothetical protein